jgi:hypothetical protein
MLYTVLELGTDGWASPEPKFDTNLTKEQAMERLDYYINEGVSPQRLRAIPQT